MAVVFLSYPVKKTTYEDRQHIQDAMEANYDAVSGTCNGYMSNHDESWSDSLYYLGQSLQYIDGADVVLVHPDWLKEYGCRKEAELAESYNKKVFYLEESMWELFDWIRREVKKPTVLAKIMKLCDERSIWTKELFAKIDISELEKVKGMGPITIRTLKDLQQKIREAK